MFKCFCFFVILTCAVCAAQAQTSEQALRRYRITLQPEVAIQPDSIKAYFLQNGAAVSVSYDPVSKEYVLLSYRVLQKNIISGKLEKYQAPLLYFVEETIPKTDSGTSHARKGQ